MNIAIVDCGTNTFNLLIAEVNASGWKVVFKNNLPVKLGAGGFEKKEIIPSRFIRGIDALKAHSANIANFGCQKTFAFATSALREAHNGGAFIKKAEAVTGIHIELVDGNKEAELIFEGVRQSGALSDHTNLIMDIGGGSTEFVIARNNQILWKQSFLLGVSRIYDAIKPADRLRHEDISALRQLLNKQLHTLKEALQQHPCQRLVGSSGSFDTLLALYRHQAKMESQSPGPSNEIPIKTFPSVHTMLMGSTFEERLKHPCIPSVRAEYMPLSSFLVKYVLELNQFESMYQSSYALKEGAIFEAIGTIDWAKEKGDNEKPEDFLEE
jgi:exopolyphosphatase/guanosine-5'-triphosphate,3'-diphosphate pyrophosphatase